MGNSKKFFGGGLFDWQLASEKRPQDWDTFVYDEERYWGGFPKASPIGDVFVDAPWALGPWTKLGNPVLAPTTGNWDCGRFSGGVHNGAVVIHEGRFHYVYRGEKPIDISTTSEIDYICDIGLAVSDDGVHFEKETEHSPFLRSGDDRRYSYEDVQLVRWGDTYYLFCNQWDWEFPTDPRVSGTFLATSDDLRHWHKHGIVFPSATRIHRNGVVVQNPQNDAVRVNGSFVMYLNDGVMAYSDDLVHWESRHISTHWPGGEGCFALADHSGERPDDIVLFTGGHHSGHFYAVGEVRFSKKDPERPLAFLPRPVLAAEPRFPFEAGLRAEPPHEPISSFRDCVFFNGLTLHDGTWWLYYGGSEYYTCLATASAAP